MAPLKTNHVRIRCADPRSGGNHG